MTLEIAFNLGTIIYSSTEMITLQRKMNCTDFHALFFKINTFHARVPPELLRDFITGNFTFLIVMFFNSENSENLQSIQEWTK